MSGRNNATLDEVDSIMAELGLSSEPTRASITISSPSNGSSSRPVSGVTEDEVDSLLKEIGASGGSKGGSPSVSVKKVSSGPGAAWAGRGKSSGPGLRNPPLSVDKMATQTPDGRAITHTGPPCASCGEMIIGQCLNALDKAYHPEHFVCAHCQMPFPNGAFIEHEGNPYCENHYNELFCPRCANCKQPISDKCVTALGNKYHPQHFTCTGCGKNLVGLPYKEDEGDIYCNACKDARKQRIAPKTEICARCKKPIIGEYITLAGQRMHPEHYRCEECGCEFKGGNCHEFEGKLYCTEDYNKLMRRICASCHKPILGRSITALSKVWHPEHFVCFVCHEPFSGSNFYEAEGKPYCETHYTQLFGTPCGKCGRPVIHNAVNFLDKVYHQEHFVCTGCDKPLKKGDINEWEGKPMCMHCYKKLPEDVRRRVEKKREAERKLAKQRGEDPNPGRKPPEKT